MLVRLAALDRGRRSARVVPDEPRPRDRDRHRRRDAARGRARRGRADRRDGACRRRRPGRWSGRSAWRIAIADAADEEELGVGRLAAASRGESGGAAIRRPAFERFSLAGGVSSCSIRSSRAARSSSSARSLEVVCVCASRLLALARDARATNVVVISAVRVADEGDPPEHHDRWRRSGRTGVRGVTSP